MIVRSKFVGMAGAFKIYHPHQTKIFRRHQSCSRVGGKRTNNFGLAVGSFMIMNVSRNIISLFIVVFDLTLTYSLWELHRYQSKRKLSEAVSSQFTRQRYIISKSCRNRLPIIILTVIFVKVEDTSDCHCHIIFSSVPQSLALG